MAFPPVFDNTWDITQPPDTQLANLLGQDIRNLKDDIMQRMSLLSGTLANRPTPETVNATWGGVGFGILYFAIDTKQVFQWNGAAWVEVTGSVGGSGFKFEASNIVPVTVGNTNVLSPLQTIILPANELSTPGQEIQFDFNGSLSVAAGGGMSISFGFYLDGTIISSNFLRTIQISANGPSNWSGFAKFACLTTGAGGTITAAGGMIENPFFDQSGEAQGITGGASSSSYAFDTTVQHTFGLKVIWNVANVGNTITQKFLNCFRIG